MEPVNTSPLPPKDTKPEYLTFRQAIGKIMDGFKVTRVEWDDNTIHCLLRDGYLCIHINGGYKQWIINDGDLLGLDWVVVPEVN